MQNSDAQVIINRIIQIEKDARSLVAAAEHERLSMPDQVKEELARRREKAMAEVDARLAAEAEATKKKSAGDSLKADQKYAALGDALEAAFAQNRNAWVEAVFQNCIDTQA